MDGNLKKDTDSLSMRIKHLISRAFPYMIYPKKTLQPAALKLAFTICPQNFGRALVLAEFINWSNATFSPERQIRIAIVGGYKDEPEIKALEILGFPISFQIFGIEQDMTQFDLNSVTNPNMKLDNNFDLVLCSQVWEHLWNHHAAFINLRGLMSNDTYLWLAMPHSNRAHGSPHFFSAGFTSQYIAENLRNLGMTVLSYGDLGTLRNYRATHMMPVWLSVKGHRYPIFFAFSTKGRLVRWLFSIKHIFQAIYLTSLSGKITENPATSTESWCLARGIN